MATTVVEVEIDLNQFDTDDLVQELQSRGESVLTDHAQQDTLDRIWCLRRQGQDCTREVDLLIWQVLGRIV